MRNKQVISSPHGICVIMMLSMLCIHGMETPQQLAATYEDYNKNYSPLIGLAKETFLIIFNYYTASDNRTSTSLEKTIKTFMHARTTCKKFNQLLTIETMGGACQSYDTKYKEIILQKLMQRMHSQYNKLRLPALIVICAGANAETPYAKIPFLEIAVSHNDEEAVEIFFKHGAKPQTEEYRFYCRDPETTDQPLFFFARTKKMVQLFIDNGVDIHEAPRNKNVLWHVIKYNYPLDVLELYLQHAVDPTTQNPGDLSCLLHELAGCSYIDRDLVKKAKLLINAMPKEMINTFNTKKQTPLDLAKTTVERLKLSPEIVTQLEELITLYTAYGGLVAHQIPRKMFTYKNFYAKNLMKQKGRNEYKTD